MTQNKTILNQNWCFRAKNRPKIAKKKKERKKNSKKFEFIAKTGTKMTKDETILSQNWAKHRDKIKKNKSKLSF